MTTNHTNKYFVKIQIAATRNSSPKEFLLSRLQFEMLVFLMPVILIWGVISTSILIKTLYIDRPAPTSDRAQIPSRMTQPADPSPVVVSSSSIDSHQQTTSIIAEEKDLVTTNKLEAMINETDAPTEKLSDQTKPLVAQTPPEASSSQLLTKEIASRSFRVDDIFDVDFSIAKKSNSSSYGMSLAMTNLKGATESGRYWVSVLATTTAGKRVWLTPMPEVKINNSGQAEDPRRGWAYSFRHFRKSGLDLKNVKLKISRFDEVMIGFERDGNSPAIAKVQLIPR